MRRREAVDSRMRNRSLNVGYRARSSVGRWKAEGGGVACVSSTVRFRGRRRALCCTSVQSSEGTFPSIIYLLALVGHFDRRWSCGRRWLEVQHWVCPEASIGTVGVASSAGPCGQSSSVPEDSAGLSRVGVAPSAPRREGSRPPMRGEPQVSSHPARPDSRATGVSTGRHHPRPDPG